MSRTINGMNVVTPSKIGTGRDIWNSGEREPGDKFTREQHLGGYRKRETIANNLRRFGTPVEYVVKMEGPPSETEPMGTWLEIHCPVVTSRRDGTMLKVITPSGIETWVGWKK